MPIERGGRALVASIDPIRVPFVPDLFAKSHRDSRTRRNRRAFRNKARLDLGARIGECPRLRRSRANRAQKREEEANEEAEQRRHAKPDIVLRACRRKPAPLRSRDVEGLAKG